MKKRAAKKPAPAKAKPAPARRAIAQAHPVAKLVKTTKTLPPGRWVSDREFSRLRDSLREAQDTLDAIRSGTVDAVVVAGTNGNQIYSLAGAEQPYRIYVEQMQEGALTLSSDGLILYCNQRFADMLGTPLARVISASVVPHLTTDSWTRISSVFGKDPESVVKHECVLQRSTGIPIAVHLTVSRLPIADQEVMCVVVTDLTEQKSQLELRLAKDVAEKASLAKDAFLAALSHELRTPLTPVLLAAVALEQKADLPEEVRRDLAMMRRNIELEARLIDDLLDLTRIAKGKLELRFGSLDLHSVLRRALEICAADITEKSQILELHLDAKHIVTYGDTVRLQQALWNLIRNAIKFTPPGGTITIRTGNQGDRIWVQVRDTGIGFQPEESHKLFQAFEQGGRHITRQFGGLGLGLAISTSILEAHGGTIRAESRGPHQGATFTIEFPLRASPADSAPTSTAAAPRNIPRLSILLVEDHKDTRASLQLYLQRMKHEVKAAENARQALDLASDHKFDLVISDLGLPDEGGGLAMMRTLRDRHNLKGIAVSGFGMEEDLQQSRAAGFSHHLTKPISLERLKGLIADLSSPP